MISSRCIVKRYPLLLLLFASLITLRPRTIASQTWTADNGNGTYSNDDTTSTFDGLVFDTVYSNVDQNNIAHGFMATLHLPLNKHLAADHCVETLQAQSQ